MSFVTTNSTYGNWYNGRPRISLPSTRPIKHNNISLSILRQISNIEISKEKSNCPICINEQKNKVIRQLDCGHKFHIECIDIWFEKNNSCPLCRKTFN